MVQININARNLRNNRQREFTEMWNGHKTRQQIIEYFQVPQVTVDNLVKQLELFSKKSNEHPYRKEMIRHAKKMYIKGCSVKTLIKNLRRSKNFRIGETTLRRLLKDHNVHMRETGARNLEYNDYSNLRVSKKRKIVKISRRTLNQKIKGMHMEGKTIRAIAKELEYSELSISTRLKEYGYRVKSKKIKINKEQLEEDYKVMTIKEIMAKHNIHNQTIYRRLKEFGIAVKNPDKRKDIFIGINKKEFKADYYSMKYVDLAIKYGVCEESIWKWVKKLGLKGKRSIKALSL